MNTEGAHYQNFEMRRLASLLREKYQGAKILDLGCGTGRNFPLMAAANCAITGVDANEAQLAELRARGFDVHDTRWEPEGESFDVIIASHVVEHMDPEQLCAFMDRWLLALKPEGSLIIATPVLGERFYYDFTHIRPYYPQSVRMMFGGIDTAKSMGSKWRMELQDIWFFRDPFRLRMTRGFYPHSSAKGLEKALASVLNKALAWLYLATCGRFGRLASWLGVYKKKEQ